MIALGIDPGLTGAIASINSATNAVIIVDMPTKEVAGGGLVSRRVDGRELANALRALVPASEAAIVTCELVHAIAGKAKGQGGMQQMGSMMRSFGGIECILDAMRYETAWVRPQEWKKFYGLRREGEESPTIVKAKSLDMARRLFPGAQDPLKRAKDHNRAEALLIAHFGLARNE